MKYFGGFMSDFKSLFRGLITVFVIQLDMMFHKFPLKAWDEKHTGG